MRIRRTAVTVAAVLAAAAAVLPGAAVAESGHGLPNDPLLSAQWNLGDVGPTRGADIDVTRAWALSTCVGVTVAVLDTGVDLSHPDLAT